MKDSVNNLKPISKYTFSENWSPSAIDNSQYIFDKIIIPNKVLEIGTFEGFYSLWIAEQLGKHEHFELHTIDPFQGINYGVEQSYFDDIENKWNSNLSKCDFKNKITFHKDISFNVLNKLYNENKKFDLIYIDGHHRSYKVLEDLTLSFNLLNSGGILLIDDATFWKYSYDFKLVDVSNDIGLTPRLAVDTFIHCNWARLDVINIPNNVQVAIRKKGLSI
jgi:hypothetical protein